jgi:hypothetical protein
MDATTIFAGNRRFDKSGMIGPSIQAHKSTAAGRAATSRNRESMGSIWKVIQAVFGKFRS